MYPTSTAFAASAVDPGEWIEHNAREHSQRPFLRTPGGRQLTYQTLSNGSGRIAAALTRRGVLSGDRVAVRLEKSLEAVLLYIACLRLGAVYVPINVGSTPNELEYLLRDSSPRMLIVPPAEATALGALARQAGVQLVETLGADGEGTLSELARQCEPEDLFAAAHEPHSLAALVYTSGTTGRPKGAMLSRASLASNAAVLAHAWHFSADDVLLHALPLFHVHGLFTAINTVLASASSLLLLPKFDSGEVLKRLSEVTVFMGVPTHYGRLLQEKGLGPEVARGMRLFISGSAPLPVETHQEFFRRTGHTILERYGMTETLMNASNPYLGSRVPGSVGLPLPGVGIRVADPESGAVERKPDVIGMLQIAGPNVFSGYWRDPAKTAAGFTDDGWFRTGDLGRIDRDGYVYIVGRAKDLVISGGSNVYPREVELELELLPGVAESAVFGVPHPDLGEGVTAAIVAKPGEAVSESAIIEALNARLARYKVPKRVLVVAELPKNAMGKVQKNALRERYAGLYLSR